MTGTADADGLGPTTTPHDVPESLEPEDVAFQILHDLANDLAALRVLVELMEHDQRAQKTDESETRASDYQSLQTGLTHALAMTSDLTRWLQAWRRNPSG